MLTLTQARPAATAPPFHNEAVARLPKDLEKLFVAHQDRVLRAAFRVAGNLSDAEDVLQTVFLRLMKNGREFGSEEEAAGYLCRAGVNAALDIVRSRRSAGAEALDGNGEAWRPDRGHHSPELRDRLREAVSQLHPTAAEMFALRYFEGYDNAEVARLMETSEGTVAVTLHRTRARLQKELGGIR